MFSQETEAGFFIMKRILILALLFTSIACSKESVKNPSGQCYICTFGVSQGVQKDPVEICNESPNKVFTDAQGNKLDSQCKLKP
jgi:hypothetical protein